MDHNVPQVWNVNRLSTVPLFQQLADNIRWSICLGNVPDGTRLPPVRTMATELSVSIDTVRAAYKCLEEMGLVITRPKHGTVVIKPAAEDGLPGAADLEASSPRPFSEDFSSSILNLLSKGRTEDEIEEQFKAALARVLNSQKVHALFIECDISEKEILYKQVANGVDYSIDFMLMDELDQLKENLESGKVHYDCVITTFFHYSTVMQIFTPYHIPVFGVVLEFKTSTVQYIATLKPETKVLAICMPQHALDYQVSFIENIRSDLDIRKRFLDGKRGLKQLVEWADVVFATHPCENEIRKIRPDVPIFMFCDQVNAQSLGILRENLKGLESAKSEITHLKVPND